MDRVLVQALGCIVVLSVFQMALIVAGLIVGRERISFGSLDTILFNLLVIELTLALGFLLLGKG
jgi:hypothetical protein